MANSYTKKADCQDCCQLYFKGFRQYFVKVTYFSYFLWDFGKRCTKIFGTTETNLCLYFTSVSNTKALLLSKLTFFHHLSPFSTSIPKPRKIKQISLPSQRCISSLPRCEAIQSHSTDNLNNLGLNSHPCLIPVLHLNFY